MSKTLVDKSIFNGVVMGSIGSPFDLYSAYRNLKIRHFGMHFNFTVDIHEYRNNELGGGYSTAAGVAEYHRLKELIGSYGSRIGGSVFDIYYPLMKSIERKKQPQAQIDEMMRIDTGFPLYNVFVGKGSPKQIADVLKLAAAFDPVLSNVHQLQAYCDKNIGIDCSGFAANYFGLAPKEVCTTGASVMAPPAKRINRLDDVRIGTAIVFTNGQHVSLVDKITKIDRTGNIIYSIDCKVAESTADQMVAGGPADGLNYTDYVLLVANKKNFPSVFKILRPLVGTKHGFYEKEVYLANWPEYDFWG